MTSRRTTLCLSSALAAGVAVASVLAAAPAQADTQGHKDKKGDVTLIKGGKPAYKTLDITRYDNDYSNGALTLTTTVVSLSDSGWDMEWRTKGGGSQGAGYVAASTDGVEYGFFNAADGSECEGATAGTEGDTVILTVPVDCLGNATSVKIANYTLKPKGQNILVDDANQGKLTPKSRPKFGDALAYTPPVG